MFKYIFRLNLVTILYIIVTPISSIFTIGLAYIMQLILNTAIQNDISKFSNVLLVSIIYILVSTLLDYFYKFLRALKLKSMSESLRNDMMSKLLNKNISDFNNYENSYFDNIFMNDIMHIENSYFNVILYAYYEFISFFVSLYLIIDINFYLAIFVILLCGIQLSIPYFSSKYSSKLVFNSSISNEKYISSIKEIIQGFEVIKTFNLEENILSKNSIINKENQNTKLKSKNFNLIINSVSFLCGEFMYVGTLLLSSIFVILEKLPVGSILASSQLMVYITSPLMNFSNIISQIKSSKDICNKLNNILQEDKNNNLRNFEFNNEIILKNINFISNNKYILKDINFSIKKNKKYIIIGDSGSGKSSFINVILNNITYNGDVFVDEINIKEIKLEEIYKNMSISRQNPYLFYDTIYNNITLNEPYEDRKLNELINNLNLDSLVKDNKDIIDKEIIKNFSGGEKQRIALCRSLLKESPILFLDECTSQLDNKMAFQIENYILDMPEKTIIMIQHRLNKQILEKADYIIIMKDGKIVNYGKYNQIPNINDYIYNNIQV